VIGWIVAVAVALLLVTSAIRISANSIWLYERLFERNDVPQRTGISVDTSLFGDDEEAHMADVKQLFVKTYLVQTFSALTLLVINVVTLYRFRRSGLIPVAAWLKRGALLVTGAIAIVGIASTVAFNQVFLLFHYIGFPQGNFTFSTRDDYLVRIFPSGFWSDITLVIGVLTVLGAAMVYAIGAVLARRTARQLAP